MRVWIVSTYQRLAARGVARAIPLLLISLGFVHFVGKTMLDTATDASIEFGLRRAEARAAGVEEWLSRSLDGVTLALDLLQKRQFLIDSGNAASSGIEDTLDNLVQQGRFDVTSALIIDPDWMVRWSTAAPHREMDMRSHSHEMVAGVATQPLDDQEIYVSDTFVSHLTHKSVVAFSRRIRHLDGSDAGIASVSIDPSGLTRHLIQMLPASGETVGVWHEGGELILQTMWQKPGMLHPARPSSPIVKAMVGKSEASLRMTTEGPMHSDVLIAARRLPGFDLIIGATVSASTVTGWIDNQRWLVWLADSLTVVLMLVGMTFQHLVQARRAAMRTLAELTANAERAAAVQLQVNQSIDALPAAIYRARYRFSGRVEIEFISSAFERLTGWDITSLMGRPGGMFDICQPPKSEDEIRALAHRLLLEGTLVRDRQIRRRDGSIRWVRISDQVISSDQDGVVVAGLITDVDIERAAVISARTAARLAALGEMASGLAHEMSQPLATMSLTAENAIAALQRERTASAIEKLRRIPAMAARAKVIIDHLRLFSRHQEVRPEPVALHDVVHGALLLTDSALQTANIQVVIDLPDNLPHVLAGQVLIEQVILNLIINARDAMETTPSAARKLHISAEHRDEFVEMSVRDTGTGIADAVLPQLFEPFFTTKPPGVGTGLGLSICHGIISSFGGRISGHNHDGGAVFSILLPIDRRRPMSGG
ncbi:MAG: ATP-binding protein [Acetobacteraceae bacterium]|nr:ATP-binding protein [Acetobacteraceae bacterium]